VTNHVPCAKEILDKNINNCHKQPI